VSRDDLLARVEALRAELRTAEEALATSYGAGVPDLARFLRHAFRDDELRRLVRYNWPAVPDDLQPNVPMVALCDDVARRLATHGVTRSALREVLVRERPCRQQDIDRALASWPE